MLFPYLNLGCSLIRKEGTDLLLSRVQKAGLGLTEDGTLRDVYFMQE